MKVLEHKRRGFMGEWITRLVFVGLMFCGCSSPVENWIGLNCDSAHPCKEGLVCDRGSCAEFVPTPAVIPECSLDLHCENGFGVPQVCYKEAGACVRCLVNSDCAPNFCTGHPTYECVGCMKDEDCPDNQVCNAQSAFCITEESNSTESAEEEKVRP